MSQAAGPLRNRSARKCMVNCPHSTRSVPQGPGGSIKTCIAYGKGVKRVGRLFCEYFQYCFSSVCGRLNFIHARKIILIDEPALKTIDVLEHKWRASLKTILILYE